MKVIAQPASWPSTERCGVHCRRMDATRAQELELPRRLGENVESIRMGRSAFAPPQIPPSGHGGPTAGNRTQACRSFLYDALLSPVPTCPTNEGTGRSLSLLRRRYRQIRLIKADERVPPVQRPASSAEISRVVAPGVFADMGTRGSHCARGGVCRPPFRYSWLPIDLLESSV
jgi:hypothetical protein